MDEWKKFEEACQQDAIIYTLSKGWKNRMKKLAQTIIPYEDVEWDEVKPKTDKFWGTRYIEVWLNELDGEVTIKRIDIF